MGCTRFTVVAAAVGLLLMSTLVNAHHGSLGYDYTRMTILKATITEFLWMNPHSRITFDALDEKGAVKHWSIEAPPPAVLTERGWTRRSLETGWVVTMYFNAARNGAPTGLMRKAVLPSGEDLWAYPSQELFEKPPNGPASRLELPPFQYRPGPFRQRAGSSGPGGLKASD